MRRLIAGLVVVLALAAVGSASASSTASAGMACTYKMRGFPIYVQMYGDALSGHYCQKIGAKTGPRFYGMAPGRVHCLFKLTDGAIYFKVISTSNTHGSYVCNLFDKGNTGYLERLR